MSTASAVWSEDDGVVVLVAPRRRELRESDAQRDLSEFERRVWRSLRHAKRRRDWLEGRLLAKQAFRLWLERTGFALDEPTRCSIVAIEAGEREGQPQLRFDSELWPDLHVSISHWPNAVGVALGCAPVGLDGEAIAVRPALADAFTTSELELVRDLTQRRGWEIARARTALWTLKEAYLKLRGTGLRAALRRCCIEELSEESVTVNDLQIRERRRFRLLAFHNDDWVVSCLLATR